MRFNRTLAALAGGCAATLTCAGAVTIDNPGFENGWDGWSDTDPSAVSGESYEGSSSAKITGSPGRVEQTVALQANTNYRLSAYIKGVGAIGATAGTATSTNSGGSSSWELVSVDFDSGSETSATIFGEYNGGEGRFDAFTLQEIGGGSPGDCSQPQVLLVSSAFDDGSNDGHGPENTIDGSLSDESRWSSQGTKWITYDMGAEVEVQEVAIVWYKGDTRTSYFSIDTSPDNANWNTVLGSSQSSGSSANLETYDVGDSSARYVRITGYGNNDNNWNSILEARILGCGEGGTPPDPDPDPQPDPDPDLDPSLPPSGNFELIDWYLSVPTDNDGSGTADSIKENELAGGYENSQYFYTASDGGMVFRCPVSGYKTSTNTSFTRTELREMLRRGDTGIATKGVNANNWVFGSAPSSARNAAGGVDGTLRASLAVNHVTTTGSSSQVGRVIIGQIHANDDEPLRLYYRKLPGNSKGSIYFAHEAEGGGEQYFEMIGSRSSSASNPSDGIALDEKFGYEIEVVGNTLRVTISRDGKPDVVQAVDMSGSGYDVSDQYQYFKAGAYNQNNTGDGSDYVQVTFYRLENSHDGYAY